MAVADTEADRRGWKPGSTAELAFTDGKKQTFTVRAVFEQSELAGDYVITREALAPHRGQDSDTLIAVSFKDGVSTADGTAAVEKNAAAYGNPEGQTRDEYAQTAAEPST
jgi:putative ABC transport system permease protein